jgi:hypothetical protein
MNAPAAKRAPGWVLTFIARAAAADRLYPTEQMLDWARLYLAGRAAPAPFIVMGRDRKVRVRRG